MGFNRSSFEKVVWPIIVLRGISKMASVDITSIAGPKFFVRSHKETVTKLISKQHRTKMTLKHRL